jgi:imidazolonepropionase-like amidohydrolase
MRAVGARRKIAIPDGAETLDARGKFIIPGLIDGHCHLEMGAREAGAGPVSQVALRSGPLGWKAVIGSACR